MSISVIFKTMFRFSCGPPLPSLCWRFTTDNGYCVLLWQLSILWGRDMVPSEWQATCASLSFAVTKGILMGWSAGDCLLLTEITQIDTDQDTVYYGEIIVMWISAPCKIKKVNKRQCVWASGHLREILLFSDNFGLAVFLFISTCFEWWRKSRFV